MILQQNVLSIARVTNEDRMAAIGQVLERVYDSKIQYTSGNFKYHKRTQDVGITFSSTPSPPSKKPQNQMVMKIRKESLKEFHEEMVLKKVIPGVDGRFRIIDTKTFPYSIHVQLSMRFSGGKYGGSGSMVGPHHVLTAAHNVYSLVKKEWAEKISLHPARNGNAAPFGKMTVTRAYIFSAYKDKKDKRFDIALLILNQSIGKFTGWGGLCSTYDKAIRTKKFHITGYPGNKGFDQMWTMKHEIKKIKPETFEYEIDTEGGQSGSAIWKESEFGYPIIMGVHTMGSLDVNSGVRISAQKFTKLFIMKIGQTYKIKKRVGVSTKKAQSTLPFPTLPGIVPIYSSIPTMAFGKAQWNKYFGDIGVESPLPKNIDKILNIPCPYWNGKRVKETHILVLIPKTINGKPLTLNTLQELIQNPKQGHATKYRSHNEKLNKELGGQSIPKSYWALITKDVLPNSRRKTYSEQQALIKGPYVVPGALEVATGILVHHVKSGEKLYPEKPYTYTRCKEKLSNGNRVVVGAFQPAGLRVFDDYFGDSRHDDRGLGGIWKF